MKTFLLIFTLLLVGCPQSENRTGTKEAATKEAGQSKKEAVQLLCDSQAKGHHDAYLTENIKHPEMATFFAGVKSGEITGEAFREQLRAHSKDAGVDCALLNMLDKVNQVWEKPVGDSPSPQPSQPDPAPSDSTGTPKKTD